MSASEEKPKTKIKVFIDTTYLVADENLYISLRSEDKSLAISKCTFDLLE